jgi:hypothetical protein
VYNLKKKNFTWFVCRIKFQGLSCFVMVCVPKTRECSLFFAWFVCKNKFKFFFNALWFVLPKQENILLPPLWTVDSLFKIKSNKNCTGNYLF